MENNSFLYSDASKETVQEGEGGMNTSELEPASPANAREGKDAAPSPGKEVHNQQITMQLVNHVHSCAST